MAVCQVCQHKNPAGAEYCEECGAALGDAGEAVKIPVRSGVASDAPSEARSPAESPPATAPGTSRAPSGETETTTPVGVDQDIAVPAGSTAPSVPSRLGSPMPAAPEAGPSTAGAEAGTGQRPETAPATGGGTAGAPAQAVGAAPAGTPGTAAGTVTQARLVAVRYGALTGEEIPLLGQRLVIGRFDPETGPVDIDLAAIPEASHISRQHGELYQEADGSWAVRDLGSTNGIFVKGNGEPSFGSRITAPRRLANGDELAFGNARFIFRIG